MFSMAAPTPAPVTITPHLVGLIYCPPGDDGSGVFEVMFRRTGTWGSPSALPVRSAVQEYAWASVLRPNDLSRALKGVSCAVT